MHEVMRILLSILCLFLIVQVNTQTVSISAGTITGQYPGNVFDLPITVNTNVSGMGIYSFQLSISRPPNCTFQSIVVEPGDLANAWGTPTSNAGTNVVVSGAGAVPLSGSGVLFRIRYQAVTSGTNTVSFTPLSANFLNEGSPALTFTNGSVQVLATPVVTISVSPSSTTRIIGETLALTASGGTAPYSFTTLHPGVGTVAGTTWTAAGQGLGKVQAQDANGHTGSTSGWYDVRTFQMGIGSASGTPLEELRVPLTIQNPGGASFYSGDLQILHTTGIQLSGIDTEGYLLQGTSHYANPAGSSVLLSFGSATPRTPAAMDTLCWLRFTKTNTTTGGSHTLSYGSILFDEYLNARTTTGSISYSSWPSIGITPNTATRQAGQTQQFTATGAPVAPLAWGVTNPAVGTINSAGLFTALNGGITRVTLTDASGNTVTTGNITVHDAVLQVVSVQGPMNGQVWVPVYLGPSVNNENIWSYQLTFSFTTSRMSFQAWETVGTPSSGWMVSPVVNGGQVTISSAGTTPFQPGTVIGYLRFQMLPAFTHGTTTPVNITSSMFNEGDPIVINQNGVVTANNGSCPTSGCTNPYACNYNPNATCEDGSCVFAVCTIKLALKAVLDGPYNATNGLMNDDLRGLGLIPLAQPYNAAPWSHMGTEISSAAVFAVTGGNAIVDWVLVELRTAQPANSIVARRSCLIQRDGDIVDVDGVSPVSFSVTSGSYRVVLHHRNHLSVITTSTYALTSIPLTLDLRNSATTLTHGNLARKSIPGTYPTLALWAGDASSNGVVNYFGTGPDRQTILNAVGSATPFSTLNNVYHNADVNMNGTVNYFGPGPDRQFVLNNVGSATPFNQIDVPLE